MLGSKLSLNDYFDKPTSLNYESMAKGEDNNCEKYETGNCNMFYVKNGNAYAIGENGHGQLGFSGAPYKRSFEKVVLPVE